MRLNQRQALPPANPVNELPQAARRHSQKANMTLDQAQQLIAELGIELGGDAKTYVMDDHGEVNMVFEGDMPVTIRFHESTLIVAAIVATEVDMDDPGLFATLMDYQFMGIRTYGAVLSWNPSTNCLLLSRQIHAEPSGEQLAMELNILLKSSARRTGALARWRVVAGRRRRPRRRRRVGAWQPAPVDRHVRPGLSPLMSTTIGPKP